MNTNNPNTKMIYECWHGKYSVEVPGQEMTLEDLMTTVVEPLLLAAGYHQKTIDSYWGRGTNY